MDNEVDKFLEGLNDAPKDDPFDTKPEDPFAQPTEEKKEEVEEKEEKVPFNKDPKIQRFIQREVDKRMADVQPNETERFVQETATDDPMDDVLTRIIGNDTPEKISAIKDFKKALSSRDEQIRQAAIDEIDGRAQEERRAEIEAQNELAQGFEDIEETFNVDLTSPKSKAIRGEFIDFIMKVAPKDEDGQVIEFPDLPETYKLFSDLKKSTAQPNRARELASRSMARSSDASVAQKTTDNSWSSVEKLLGKLRD